MEDRNDGYGRVGGPEVEFKRGRRVESGGGKKKEGIQMRLLLYEMTLQKKSAHKTINTLIIYLRYM